MAGLERGAGIARLMSERQLRPRCSHWISGSSRSGPAVRVSAQRAVRAAASGRTRKFSYRPSVTYPTSARISLVDPLRSTHERFLTSATYMSADGRVRGIANKPGATQRVSLAVRRCESERPLGIRLQWSVVRAVRELAIHTLAVAIDFGHNFAHPLRMM